MSSIVRREPADLATATDSTAALADDEAAGDTTAPAESAPLQSAGRRKPAGWLKPAFLLIALLAVYSPALDGEFLWDDADNIVESIPLRSVDGLRRIWLEPGATQQYFPLLHSLWRLEYQAFGETTRGYHVVNILLHFVACVLLARVLRLLAVPHPWFTAALFGLHPICVESVAWITEGKNTLSLGLFLAALAAYLRSEGFTTSGTALSADAAADSAKVSQRRLGWYLASIGLFTAAILSKTNAAALPGVILVLLAWKRGRLVPRDFLRVVPMLAIAAGVAAVVIHIETNILGAGREEFDWPWSHRILIAGRACWFYLGKILLPYPLTFIYPRWQIDPSDATQWLYPLTALALPPVLWTLRRRIGTAPLVVALCFGGTLLPQLGLLPIYGQLFSFVADHWAYLSAVAPLALASAALARLVPERRGPQTVAALALLGLLGGLTYRQSQLYARPETVWADTIAKNPECWLAHHNLAVLRIDEGNLTAAAAGIDRALELRPVFKEAVNNRGLIALKQKRLDAAKRDFQAALTIDPRFADAHANLAAALIPGGHYAEAVEHLQAALARKPHYPKGRASLGLLYARTGRPDEGIRELTAAINDDPGDVQAWSNLGTVLASQGKLAEARNCFTHALELDPSLAEALAGLGGLALAQGDLIGAQRALVDALEIDPQNADLQFNLGNVLYRRKLIEEAVAAYRRALVIVPDHAPARVNLAAVLYGRGERDEARRLVEEVLQASPDNAGARRLWQQWNSASSLPAVRPPATILPGAPK